MALAHITVPCETPNIVESKSFKLYLNSFNNTRFADAAEVQARIRADISEAVWRGAEHPASVGVKLIAPIAMDSGLRFAIREGGRTVGAGVVSKIIK